MGFFDFITTAFSGKKGKPRSKGNLKLKHGGAPASQTAQESNAKLQVAKNKQRKKATKVSSASVNEEALGFSISLKDGGHARKREAIRIIIPGLMLHVHRLKKSFPAINVSATGIGFKFEKPRIKGGVKLEVDIILDDEILAEKILCKVMRHEKGTVGCSFVELDRPQDDAVHKLVLLGQKMQAERKKKGFKAQTKPTKL